MKLLTDTAKRLNKIDSRWITKKLFDDKRFRELAIQLNTMDQLYNKGIDANGEKLISAAMEKAGRAPGTYSQATIEGTKDYEGKADKGQRYDHITLSDSFMFYNSFVMRVTASGWKITAQTIKGDSDLLKVWGDQILGLTDENLQKLIDLSRLIIIPLIKKQILNQAA